MTAIAASISHSSSARSDIVPVIAQFVRGFSIEATRPTREEVTAFAGIAESSTRVYVSAVSTRPPQDVIEAAIRLRAAGFQAVPHVAVRMFATAGPLDDFLTPLAPQAPVEPILILP